ncbi:ER degradation-enhancing alpha-mannosidase-like protein 2 [Harmonia axyridis]|uniref:ER degradation-enhancing alpha-mannosidase-like protein 2 n=1 Tax=Harmonia axyridis TaxID=115357 RepID=UPI001E279604|nr:ER degradation-enhancing alpha-mannosidase-like protein 2 [Harmonia axyridis]
MIIFKNIYLLPSLFFFLLHTERVVSIRSYNKKDLNKLRDEVKEMFYHAYNSYLKFAYPYDELRPLSCDGIDTYGSYSLTLIDALDTLAIMGNYTEFQRVVDLITSKSKFDANINVSVFETNIRIIGGLLSAHLLSYRAGVKVEPGWPCNGPLLRLAEDVAQRLIVAFDTKTGMPYGTVNLKHGVPKGETTITCTAGIGTFIVEFGTLSRLTGNSLYEEVAMNALYALFNHKSQLGLFGNHIDIETGRWTAQDAGIGSGVDSYFEYLVKGSILLQRPELMEMFHEARKAFDKHMKKDDWYMWVSMTKGQITLPVFQSLEAFWPGVLSLIGDTSSAMRTLHNYHQVWQQYGFTPEFYHIPQTEAGLNKESWPLRPELIESIMLLYRSTGDPFLLQAGEDILRSIQHSSRTPCGYATIKDVRDHRKEDRMESFFLSETTKYLYLLFDTDNFIHNQGQHGTVIDTPNGECIIETGGYIFNTEAHPVDPSALHCCYDLPKQNIFNFTDFSAKKHIFRGETINGRKKKLKETINSDSTEETTSNPQKETQNSNNDIRSEDSSEISNDSLKIEDIDFKVGDGTDGEGSASGDTLDLSILDYTVKVIQSEEKTFDPNEMLARFKLQNKFPKNTTWENKYELLSCKAQPFLQKLSIFGEFFNR